MSAADKVSSYALEPSSIASDISEKLSASTKKRGRPRKNEAVAVTSTQNNDNDVSPVVKKKRGRPRKSEEAK